MSTKLSWEHKSSAVSCLERTSEQSERQAFGCLPKYSEVRIFLSLKIRFPSAVNEMHKPHQNQQTNDAYGNNRCIRYES
jgi:hypothetical protein